MRTSSKRHKIFHHSNAWFYGGSLANELIYHIVEHLDMQSVKW
jgi:hypothetical protein